MRLFLASTLIFAATTAFAQEAPAPAPALAPAPAPAPLSAADAAVLLQRLDDLEQQHRILERKIELANEQAAVKAKEIGNVSFSSKGFAIRSGDGRSFVSLRGLVQADGRHYFNDDKSQLADTFILRRVRPILDATLFDLIDVRIMPDFGQNQVVLFDAYVDVHPWRWLRLRAGKFKPPVGLERLQGAANIHFIERALPTALVPNRDLGVTIGGEVGSGTFSYAIGVFNGVVDGANTPDIDLHDGKELAVRVFAHPFRPLRDPLGDNFGVGFAATYGNERGRTTAPNVPSYKTPGQQTFFSFINDTTKPNSVVVADGARYRLTPQLYWYVWHFGLLAEYVYSAQTVLKADQRTKLGNQAWQVLLSVVLTPGDRATFDGLQPKRPFDFKHGNPGGIELVARYHELRVDNASFPTFADDTKSAKDAQAFGVGANWYLNGNLRFALNYEHTTFTKGNGDGGNRYSEDAFFGRLQLGF